MKKVKMLSALALALGIAGAAFGDYQYAESYSSSGDYTITNSATDVTLSGTISGDVSLILPDDCRVTLSGLTLTGALAITGDAELFLSGANTITSTGASAIECSGALTISGTGTLSATGAGAKKTGVIAAADLILAGGATTVTIANPSVKNACGVSLSGNYAQQSGTLKIVGNSSSYKQNGVFLAKKNTTATISGGTLEVTLAGEKSVGLAMDKETSSCTMTAGSITFTMSGDGAKGVKGDGAFTMSGGTLTATLSGGVVEDYFEYEDSSENTWYYYVTLTSSTKTSGGTSTYNTSSLIGAGTYPVMDPSKCYAVKVGTLAISGGTVSVKATGTAGRGLGADTMTLSGGSFDIAVSGGPTDVYVESLVDSDDLDDSTYSSGVTTCLDSGAAACLKTSGTSGVLTISGGTFNLKATGNAGKLINAGGYLVIGKEGVTTLPDAKSFSPDITGSTTGSKVYSTAVKQKYYGSLATATATTSISSITFSNAAANLVTSSSGSLSGGMGGPGGMGGMAGGAPGDDDADYSNPKAVKGYSGVTMHSGRLTLTTKNDGGEGLESKNDLVINGGVIDLECYDDCINSGGDLYINGGYIYALATGNDPIDSNANIYISDGIVVAISTAGSSEIGIDTDNSTGLVVNGGHVVAVGGAAGNMVVGSSGSQKTYLKTSLSATSYSGKYLSMTGSDTFSVKLPTLSGTISLVCTTEGWSKAGTPKTSSSAPSTGAIGFRNMYLASYTSSSGSSASGDDDDSATDDDDSSEDDTVVVSDPATGDLTETSAHGVFSSDGTPIASTSAQVYDGYILSGDTVEGTVLLKVGKANTRTRLAKFTATVQLLGEKKRVYSTKIAVSETAPTTFTIATSNSGIASPLKLTVAGDYMSGSVAGLAITGARNQSGSRDSRKSEYAAANGKVINIALAPSNASGSGAAFANGYGALMLKVLAKGKAKLSGVMADGTKVSVSGLKVLLSEDGAELCIPVVAPMYKGKLGGFGMLVWLGATGSVDITAISSWDASVSTSAQFTSSLSCADAALIASPADGSYGLTVDADEFPATIGALSVQRDLLPSQSAVTATSGRLSAVTDTVTRLKISRVATTGLIKGSFAAYVQNGEKLSRKTAKFNGVMINGVGYGSAVIKGAGTASVTITKL